MTTQEKLNNFYTIVIEEANKKSEQTLGSHQKSLSLISREAEEACRRKADSALLVAKDHLFRSKNKTLSDTVLDARRTVSLRTEEIKDEIFSRLTDKLLSFKETSDYPDFLIQQVKKMKEFAKQNELTLYLDPSDSRYQAIVEQEADCKLILSDRSFLGGIRGVISSKNILLDASFTTRLAEQKESYKL